MEKQFVGSVKVINTQHGELIKISFGDKDRAKLEEMKNEKGYVNLVLKKSKNTEHPYYLEVDTWKPNSQAVAPIAAPAHVSNDIADDLPF